MGDFGLRMREERGEGGVGELKLGEMGPLYECGMMILVREGVEKMSGDLIGDVGVGKSGDFIRT